MKYKNAVAELNEGIQLLRATNIRSWNTEIKQCETKINEIK